MSEIITQTHPIVDLTPDQPFITPDYTKPYSPLAESIEFFSWCNVALGKEDTASPKTHYMLIDEMFQDDPTFEALCHRGFAKSTLTTKNVPLYVASKGEMPGFGRVTNMPIFSASYSQAVGLIKDLRSAWETSDFLQDTLRLAENRNGKAIANKENHICFSNEQGQWAHIMAFSSGEQVRGTKVPDQDGVGRRFELMFFDDILKDAILDSVKEREKLKRWFFSSIMPAVRKNHHKAILIGTPMTQDELLSEFKMSKRVKTICFPVASKMPVKVEEIVSSWPTLHTPQTVYDSYEDAKAAGALNDWFRENMLEVVNKEMQVFNEKNLTNYFYDTKKKDFPTMNFFTTVDMAVKKGSKSGKVAVITIGIDERNHWWIVAADEGYFTPTETIGIMFKHNRQYNSLDTRGEKAALQQVLDHFVEIEMERQAYWFNTGYLKTNSVESKENRVMALQPRVKRKMIHFPVDKDIDAINELKHQLLGFTKDGFTTPFKDLADALANFTDEEFVYAPGNIMGSEVGADDYYEEHFGY